MRTGKQEILTLVLFAVYLLLLTAVILFKLPFYSPGWDERAVNLIPLMGSFDERGVLGVQEIAYNILLFVPLGIYICLMRENWPLWKKLIPIIGLTVTFEAAQFIFALGRSDITDVLGNTLGGIIGIGIYALLLRLFKDKTVSIVILAALLVTVCITARFAQLYYLSHFVMMPPDI
ncbi:MAG: VanZ family protein [Coriobacteriales bacterium]|nr:VanZ family protein [Coriobacteriales bacterium]